MPEQELEQCNGCGEDLPEGEMEEYEGALYCDGCISDLEQEGDEEE